MARLSLSGIDKALQCDSQFTAAMAATLRPKPAEPTRTSLSEVRGGIGRKKLDQQQIQNIRDRQRKARAARLREQQTIRTKA